MDAADKSEQLLLVLCTTCMRSPRLGIFITRELLNVVIIPQKHVRTNQIFKDTIAYNYIFNYSKYDAFCILRKTEGSAVPGAMPLHHLFPQPGSQ